MARQTSMYSFHLKYRITALFEVIQFTANNEFWLRYRASRARFLPFAHLSWKHLDRRDTLCSLVHNIIVSTISVTTSPPKRLFKWWYTIFYLFSGTSWFRTFCGRDNDLNGLLIPCTIYPTLLTSTSGSQTNFAYIALHTPTEISCRVLWITGRYLNELFAQRSIWMKSGDVVEMHIFYLTRWIRLLAIMFSPLIVISLDEKFSAYNPLLPYYLATQIDLQYPRRKCTSHSETGSRSRRPGGAA